MDSVPVAVCVMVRVSAPPTLRSSGEGSIVCFALSFCVGKKTVMPSAPAGTVATSLSAVVVKVAGTFVPPGYTIRITGGLSVQAVSVTAGVSERTRTLIGRFHLSLASRVRGIDKRPRSFVGRPVREPPAGHESYCMGAFTFRRIPITCADAPIQHAARCNHG